MVDTTGDSGKPKRASRLGRGLSSLMARPVAAEPPAEQVEASPKQGVGGGSGEGSGNGSAAAVTAPPVADEQIRQQGAGDEPSEQPQQGDRVVYLPLGTLQPNRHQPRQRFAEGPLQKLADSIRSEGLIQPIVARRVSDTHQSPDAPSHEIVAGERRWRAARLAGLESIPVIVRELDDQQVAQWALIENLQREDLNPIERAQALQQLIDLFSLSHDQVASQVGIERSTVSNLLRLLALDETVRDLVADGHLSMGQARALAGMTNLQTQRSLATQAIRQEWSVRRLEQAVRQASGASGSAEGAGASGGGTGGPSQTADSASAGPTSAGRSSAILADLERQIGEQLGTKARIKRGRRKGTGSLTLDFYSLDQFDSLLTRLGITTE